jgi:hypothetical protein
VTLDGQNSTRILTNPWVAGGNNLTIQNIRFINGKVPAATETGTSSGGAIRSGSPGTRLHIINTTFENNSTTSTDLADNQGGAIFSSNSYETVIANSVFQGNVAGNGGAIGAIASGMIIYNSLFRDNHAVDTTTGGIVRGYGGALHLDGVTNPSNPDSNKTLDICGSTFDSNTSIRGGGATSSVVSDAQGTKATFDRSYFVNNETYGLNGEFGQGGALYHIEDDHAGGIGEDNLLINASTFTNNRAWRQGGGVWLYILGNGTIVNSTLEGNRTTTPPNTVGQGGAMAINKGLITIANTTFAYNHAAYQGGAVQSGGASDELAVTLRNTIFYHNTLNVQEEPSSTKWQGYHTNRVLIDGGNNIQYPQFRPDPYNNDTNNNITDNPIYADPLLTSLSNYGGPVPTMWPLTGSPAVDAVDAASCPATDQRGVARPVGGTCDIGAVEIEPRIPAFVPFVRQ